MDVAVQRTPLASAESGVQSSQSVRTMLSTPSLGANGERTFT